MTTKTEVAPEDPKKRAILLKRLRQEHQETVTRTQARLKEQQAIRRQICAPMRSEPKAVPELAAATGIPAGVVLWHITAMCKYGLVVETGICGEYYLYQMTKDDRR